MSERRVLLCFFIQEAFSIDEKELPQMIFQTTFHGSVGELGSLLT